VLNKESQVILSTQDFVDQRIRPSSQKLWVIESFTGFQLPTISTPDCGAGRYVGQAG